jgi:regulatory protein
MNGRRGRGQPRPDAAAPSPYQQALGLLVRREHSRAELARKLKARGVEGDDADAALATLARQDFQNDERFAQALARTRAAAGYGPVRIRAELSTHALPRDAIAAAMDTCDTDWDQQAKDLVSRRFSAEALAKPEIRRKAVDFLLRRGFESRSAMQAVRARGDEID